MHAQEVKAVELLMLTSAPCGPSTQFHEFIPSKFSTGAFCGGGRVSLKRMEELVNVFDRKIIDVIIVDENGVDGTELLSSNGKIIVGFDVRNEIVIETTLG
jgi:hypothetical protein